MSDVHESTIKVIRFNGKRKDFLVWKAKFMARANQKKVHRIISGDDTIPAKSDYEVALAIDSATRTAAQKLTVKNYEASVSVYSDLLLSMDASSSAGKVAFLLVHHAVTIDNPEGDPKSAFDKLMKKFEPKTAPNFIALEKKFANSKLVHDEEDPDK